MELLGGDVPLGIGKGGRHGRGAALRLVSDPWGSFGTVSSLGAVDFIEFCLGARGSFLRGNPEVGVRSLG